MKRKKLPRAIIRTGSAMIFCSIITGTMWAQGIPSVTNIPNAQYPMVNPDRTVTFKVKAPDAKSVQIVLDRPYEMQKGQDGTWGTHLFSASARFPLLLGTNRRLAGN
ncbi:MAG: hypothetical protein ACLVEU_06230 [Bacteroides cellulosilyticus]